eukprot:347701-Chlamydomonas_euryale.AAC.7
MLGGKWRVPPQCTSDGQNCGAGLMLPLWSSLECAFWTPGRTLPVHEDHHKRVFANGDLRNCLPLMRPPARHAAAQKILSCRLFIVESFHHRIQWKLNGNVVTDKSSTRLITAGTDAIMTDVILAAAAVHVNMERPGEALVRTGRS